jgi:hypothetical protein
MVLLYFFSPGLGSRWLAKALYLGFASSFLLSRDYYLGVFSWTVVFFTYIYAALLLAFAKKATEYDKAFFEIAQFFLTFLVLFNFSIDRQHLIPIYFSFFNGMALYVVLLIYMFRYWRMKFIINLAFTFAVMVLFIWNLFLFLTAT